MTKLKTNEEVKPTMLSFVDTVKPGFLGTTPVLKTNEYVWLVSSS